MLTIPREGLVAEYYLNGDATDTSGNGHNGTATDVTRVDTDIGYQSKCASFNGDSSKIETGLDVGGKISISMFVRFNEYDKYQYIYDNESSDADRFLIYCSNDNMLSFYIGGTKVISLNNANKTLGYSYNHIVCTFEDGNQKIFVNNKLITTNTTSYDETKKGTNLTFGKRYTDKEYLDGDIQLVRIYNRILSKKEINILYLEGLKKLNQDNNTIPELFKGCVAYYDFRGGDLSNLITGEKATNNGAALTADHFGYENCAYNGNGTSDMACNINGLEGSNVTFVSVFKCDNSSDMYCLFSQRGNKGGTVIHSRGFRVNENGDFVFFSRDSGGNWHEVVYSIELGKYYFCAGIQEGGIIRLYINGNKVGEYDMGSTTTFYNYFKIFNYTDSDYKWHGNADLLILFNRALSDSEIKTLYNLLMK